MAAYHNRSPDLSSPEYDAMESDEEASSFSLPMTNSDSADTSRSSAANSPQARSENTASNFSPNSTDSRAEANEEENSDNTEEYNWSPPPNRHFAIPAPLRAQRQGRTTIEIEHTEEYEVPRLTTAPGQVIELADTQVDQNNACSPDEDDDDVILVPEHIETIDLCTQTPNPAPFAFPNEVIEIEDSPANATSSRRSSVPKLRKVRRELNSSPYNKQAQGSSSSPPAESQTQSVLITCPVCLESVTKRQPVSTTCGHVYCKGCLVAALAVNKCCPMCKKSLKAKNSFHSIYLGN